MTPGARDFTQDSLVEERAARGRPPAPLRVLTGCTAVGKTELALAWAEARGAEIVSCDSLLFYRGMDIGSAKPTPAERARVPHHLIDIAEPDEPMDVSRYLGLALSAVRDIQARGREVLVTGGSGFYLKAFFAPVVDGVTVSEASARAAAERVAAGLPAAVAELRRRNPAGLGDLDIFNPRRVVKALERCIETGQTLAELARDFASRSNPLTEARKVALVLDRDNPDLEQRIARRVSAMLEQGLVEEVERLQRRGVDRNPSAARAIGYREVAACLRGELDRAALADAICQSTRRLAKKQRTWFRGQLPADAAWINLTREPEPDFGRLFA